MTEPDSPAPPKLGPWPDDAPCWKCGEPVGPPWSERLIPRRPICPTCAWENLKKAVLDDE